MGGTRAPKSLSRREAASHYVIYHGAHHDDVPSILRSGLRGESDQPTVTTSREGAELHAQKRDWTAPKVVEIHVPREQAGRYLEEGEEGMPIEGTIHALKETLPPSFIRMVHEAARYTPSSGIFAPTTGLDHRLFNERFRLRPEVTEAIMSRLDTCLRTDAQLAGSDWQEWLHVWIFGGSVSEWAGDRPNETAQDLDVLVGITDLAVAQGYNAFEGMDRQQAATALNAAFRACFNEQHWQAPFGGFWDLTAYCNPAVTDDIEAIRPYAAWDLTDGAWAVQPPHLPEHGIGDFDPAVIAHARAVAAEARAILRMAEPLRTREATALWEHLHEHRCQAFSEQGTGWDDPGNIDEKFLAYAPRNLLGKIKELALAPKTAAAEKPAKTKAQVNYRPGSDAKHCGNCVMIRLMPPDFETHHCTLVKGNIDPAAVCDEWVPEKTAKTGTRNWDDKSAGDVYLRFGDWPANERSRNNITGHREEGVSAYDLDEHGEPKDPDPNMERGHEHDEGCDDDCDLDEFNDEYGNDTGEEMHGRVTRAERARYYGSDERSGVGHLVRGEMVGLGHDAEPLLQNVRRVGDWIDHRHLFIPGAPKHRLARDPHDEDYEPPEETPPAHHTAAAQPCTYCGEMDHGEDEHCGYCGDRGHDPVEFHAAEVQEPWHAILPGVSSIHRAMALRLSDEDHAIVHDPARPQAERARHLLNAVGGRPLGMHWTSDRGRQFAEEFAHPDHALLHPGEGPERATGIMLHALTPHPDDVEDNPERLIREKYWSYGEPEYEIPMKEDAPVDVTGISWRHGRHGEWNHHEFGSLQHKTAAAPQGYLRNPYHGTEEFGGNPEWSHTWFHGTRGEPDFGTRRKDSEEARRAALPPDERTMNFGWSQPNQHLGVHFSPLHEVAHKFAPSTWSGTTSIAHVRLRGSSPAHFQDENHLNMAIADWASQHYPGWHHQKLNDSMAWQYSDQEGTHRDFSQVPEDNRQRYQLGHKAESLLQWHPHMPEILSGFRQHLKDQGHHGITYGNNVEGPYLTDATRGGDAYLKYERKAGNWPSGTPRSISAIAHPDDVEITHVEHLSPWQAQPEPHQRTWEDASDQDENDEMRDKVLSWHREQGGKLPFKLASNPDRYVTCDQGHEHWGALGAAGLLIRHQGGDGGYRYLLQHRSPYVQHGGTWSTPGGALQHGESPEEGARREAEEEFGGLPAGLKHHHTVTDDHGGWAYHTVVLDAPRKFEPEGDGEGDWEHGGHGWFTPQEMKDLPLHPGFAASWDKVRKSGAVIRLASAVTPDDDAIAAEPHRAAVSIAQEKLRRDYPELNRPLGEQRTPVLRQMLTRASFALPEGDIEHAWAGIHEHPEHGVSQPAEDEHGHRGVMLHPDRDDPLTLAHEAGHLITMRRNEADESRQRQPWEGDRDLPSKMDPDHRDHGHGFAWNMALALDGGGHPQAAEDLRRHYTRAVLDVADRRHAMGLPRNFAGSGLSPHMPPDLSHLPPVPAEQQRAFDAKDYKQPRLDLAKNPVPGTKIWRGERRPAGEDLSSPESVGLHWSVHPSNVITDRNHGQSGERPVIWQARLEHPQEQAIPRSHPMWGGRHQSMDSEAEVRLHPHAAVHVEGAWVGEPDADERGQAYPLDPRRNGPGWTWHPVGHDVPVRYRGSGATDYSSFGIHREGAAEEDASYRQPHQGPDAEDGEALHELGTKGFFPADVHDHPDWYGADEQTARQVRRGRGDADARIVMYRAMPSPHHKIHPGDWVTLSQDYALEHAAESSPDNNYAVLSKQVRAHQLRNDGNDLSEWTYHGPTQHFPKLTDRGGKNGGWKNSQELHKAQWADAPPPHEAAADDRGANWVDDARKTISDMATKKGHSLTWTADEIDERRPYRMNWWRAACDNCGEPSGRPPQKAAKALMLPQDPAENADHWLGDNERLPHWLTTKCSQGRPRQKPGPKPVPVPRTPPPPGHPARQAATRHAWYHGTAHSYQPGDLVDPAYAGTVQRTARPGSTYFTHSLNQATDFADWAQKQHRDDMGEYPAAHVYEVEPTGDFEEDPDDSRNAWVSRSPLRIVRHVMSKELGDHWPKQAATGYTGLTGRTAMIYLEIPEGLVEPHPGGVDDHHITLVYLGKNVSDEAWAEACRRAKEAAAQCPPMDGVLRGIGIFPPSASSDGKVPAFVPAYIGGVGALRRKLEDLSASEHKDYTPHLTLAYLEEGDSLPAARPAAHVRFTRLHAKRGDEIVSYPLGGGDMSREAGAGPAFYHGSYHDLEPDDELTPEGANRAGRKYPIHSSEKHIYYTDDMGLARAYGPKVYQVQPLAPDSGRGRDRKRLHDPEEGFPREHEYLSTRGFRVIAPVDADEAQRAWDDRTARRWKSRGGQEAIRRMVDRDGPEGLPESARPHYRPGK